MCRRWKIRTFLSLFSALLNLMLVAGCIVLFLRIKPDTSSLTILLLFTALFILMVVNNFFSAYCYFYYPRRGPMLPGTRLFFIVMRTVGSVHTILTLVAVFIRIRSATVAPRATDAYGILILATYCALSFYLTITQFIFPEYLKGEEKKKIKAMIGEIGC